MIGDQAGRDHPIDPGDLQPGQRGGQVTGQEHVIVVEERHTAATGPVQAGVAGTGQPEPPRMSRRG